MFLTVIVDNWTLIAKCCKFETAKIAVLTNLVNQSNLNGSYFVNLAKSTFEVI
jgi:hypothetical protein